MAFRTWRFRELFRVLPQHLCSDFLNQQSRGMFPALFTVSLPPLRMKENDNFIGGSVRRCSTVSGIQDVFLPQIDFLPFVESTLDEIEGPYHCWMNSMEESKELLKWDGYFLVLVGAFLENSLILDCDHMLMIERVKLLQNRFPKLHVFGFQYSSSVHSVGFQTRISWAIMKEYITFPILLSRKNFAKMTNGPCYLLFEGFRRQLHYYEKDVELRVMSKAIEELNLLQNGNTMIVHNSNITRMKQAEVIKDPWFSFKNLLLNFPGSISADEEGERLFLSDTNHHRIIIIDANGKVLDCIGSSPGFEDGEFETAKLLRPASSIYDATEGCLYFADSENHAIRRADIVKRTVQTVYPICDSDSNVSLWSWIMVKLGMGKKIDPDPEDFGMSSFNFPWHLMKLEKNNLLITNSSFSTLWIMNATTGEIKETVKGLPNIVEICGQIIKERVSLLEEVNGDLFQLRTDDSSLEGLPHAGLVSSLATLENNIIFCDTACQRVLKYDRGSRYLSHLQFSNLGILGLPYWLACPLERVFIRKNANGGPRNSQLQHFNVLPGRCNIRVSIDIPEGTKLSVPLQEGSIWCQARGSSVEVSGSEGEDQSTEKVGVSQQWFDELDNLAFSDPVPAQSENKIVENLLEDGKPHIACAVNISPGTSEIVIYAALYLQLDESKSSTEYQDLKKAEKMLEISVPEGKRKQYDACKHLLLQSCSDLSHVVFMKSLHLRIYLKCGDYPLPQMSKDIILTNSSIEVHVSLD